MNNCKETPGASATRPVNNNMKALKKEGVAHVGRAYIKTERYGRRMRAALKRAAKKNSRAAGKAAAAVEN